MDRRLRGLIGTTLTWGVLGAVLGLPVFVAVMRPWPLSAIRWERFLTLLAVWEGASVLWGLACGLCFAFALLAVERRQRQQLTPTRVAAWGALAGAFFPAVITFGALFGGGDPFYFGGIVAASALTGGIWARMSVALARRAPTLAGADDGELLREHAL
jgi:hypothetical protein